MFGFTVSGKAVPGKTGYGSPEYDFAVAGSTASGGDARIKERQIIAIHLKPDSVLVMDNMKSHHAKAIKQLLEEAKVRYAFLPPYSPDLNPIENLWSKVKALLRKFKPGNLETLPDAIQRAIRAVTPSDCSGWFCACGYSR